MNDTFDHHEFDKRLAVLEERMKTVNAENASAQERLNATLERFHTAIADLKKEMANQKVWLFALVFGAVVTGITLGLSFAS